MTNHKPNIYQSNICPPCPPSATTFEKIIYWIGIGLGSGLPKKAPGTWGTVGGFMLALPMIKLGFFGFLTIVVAGCLLGSYICGKTSELMNVHDDPHIVFDEWVGVWIALLPIAFLSSEYYFFDLFNYRWLAILFILLIFILFRLFDIVKPFPINWADKKVSGGLGIMLDDILAGIMSAGLWIILLLIFLVYLK